MLGDMGLRSHEARSLRIASIASRRSDGLRPWLTVIGKGDKIRKLPMATDVDEALLALGARAPKEQRIAGELGSDRRRPRRGNGSYPDAGAQLSGQALSDVVKPIMLAAGVPAEYAHPHVLRHTYGSLFMRNGGELSKLQALMGHASSETTSLYVHHTRDGLEAAVAANETAACSKRTPTDGAGAARRGPGADREPLPRLFDT